MSKSILIYSPFNLRAVDQQAQAELLIRNGHKVFLLTWDPLGPLHDNFKKLGAQAFSANNVKGRSALFFLNHALYLARFCREHKIDIVFSHLQSNALVAGIARRFVRIKSFYFRHNSDYIALGSSAKQKWLNKWANRFSPHIVAISDKVKEQLIKEGVNDEKIIRINLCYNFSQYLENSQNAAMTIRKKYKADMLLLAVARLDPLKRHLLAFQVIKKLVGKGVDCKLVSIGDGPMRRELEHWISDNNMQDHIFMEGFVTNTVDYFEAADALMHLSYSEASSHVVKEAGITNRTVFVCKGVGDFDDYLCMNENAFLLDKENPEDEAVTLLANNYREQHQFKLMGENLCRAVMENFSIDAVEKKYQELLNI